MTVLGGNSQVFDTLSERLSGTFRKLTGKAVLSEENIQDALREVRRALLEAAVALAVVKETAVAILAFMVFLFLFTLYNVGVFDRQI